MRPEYDVPQNMMLAAACANGHDSEIDLHAKRSLRKCPTCKAPLVCTRADCLAFVNARGVCNKHYIADRHPKTRGMQTDWERFHTRYDLDSDTGCWVWHSEMRNGYGYFNIKVDGKWRDVTAHTWSWKQRNGPVPDGLVLDHFKCDRPSCANPDHLRPVTNRENLLRGETLAAKNCAKTACDHGHPFDADNTRYDKHGDRYCRTCTNIRGREWRQRRKAAAVT